MTTKTAVGRVLRDDVLNRDDLGADLARRASRGTLVALVSQWSRFVLQLGSTVMLARMLTPDDFGVVAMVAALTGLADVLTGLGLSTATVQRRRVTDDQISTLFWLNVVLGATVAVVVAASSPLVAAFYDRPELHAVTVVLASTFLMAGCTVQLEALIVRRMRFVTLAVVDIGSMAVAVVVAIVAADQGAGYWALVLMAVVRQLARLVIVWRTTPWRPGRPRRRTGVRSMVTFGANLSVFSVLNYASRNFDNVLIGRRWGAMELGLYAKAYQLLMFPIQQFSQPVARVAIPTLSHLQGNAVRFVRYYRSAIVCLAFTCMPLIVLMAVLSEELVLLLLGEDWLDAAPVFHALAFAGIAQTVSFANGWLYVSTGHTGRQAAWALVSRPVVIGSFVLGLPWGPFGVALSYTLTSYVLLIPAFALAVRDTPVTLRSIGRSIWRPASISAAVYVGASFAHGAVEVGGRWGGAIAALTVGVALFIGGVWTVPGARSELRDVVVPVIQSMGRSVGRPTRRAPVPAGGELHA